jgi:adenylylsulfate reductase subunit A
MMKEMYVKGDGPILMQTHEAIERIAASAPDEKTKKKKMKELEAEAWEDFLDMTISQAMLWASKNIYPEKGPSEIAPSEPYFIGSHSGASGAWCSGPVDLQSEESKKDYFWGYNRMSTIRGLFAAGDGVGDSSHKFTSGSYTEGRIAAKAAIKFCVENPEIPSPDQQKVDDLRKKTYAPMKLYEDNKDYAVRDQSASYTYSEEINPNYIDPKMLMFRIQKIMDEYAGGWGSQYTCSATTLKIAQGLLKYCKEDLDKVAARDIHELLRYWENVHRLNVAEAHVRHKLFREETRWPGYYYRSDFPRLDEKNWGEVFVNSKYDSENDKWEMIKRPNIRFVKIEKVVGM